MDGDSLTDDVLFLDNATVFSWSDTDVYEWKPDDNLKRATD